MANFSKWLLIPVLLDGEEMGELFEALGDFYIFDVSRVLAQGEGDLSRSQFLEAYSDYIVRLKSGEVRPSPLFSACLTTGREDVEVSVVPGGREIRKPCRPVVQLQPHTFAYSKVDGKFRSMVRGEGAISWGIQFSYPQLFEDPVSRQIVKVDKSFPNTALFQTLRRWVRHHTLPTPFEVDGRRVNVPIRTGKRSFEWVAGHPQLGDLCLLKS